MPGNLTCYQIQIIYILLIYGILHYTFPSLLELFGQKKEIVLIIRQQGKKFINIISFISYHLYHYIVEHINHIDKQNGSYTKHNITMKE